jgi:hypothetical protein
MKIIIPWSKWLGFSTQSGEPSGILELVRPADLQLSAVRTIDTSVELNMPPHDIVINKELFRICRMRFE